MTFVTTIRSWKPWSGRWCWRIGYHQLHSSEL